MKKVVSIEGQAAHRGISREKGSMLCNQKSKEAQGMIKRISGILLAAAVAALVALPPAFAAETSADASVGVYSSYVWRGITVHEEAAVQPSVSLGYEGFGINLWSDWNSETRELVETDLTLDYAFSFEKLGLDAGYIYYGLEGFADTQEFYVSASYDTLLSPSLTLYWDVDEGDGGFVVASVGHSVDLGFKGAALNLGASASANLGNAVMGLDEAGEKFTGLYNGELSASVSIPLNGEISLEPMVAYSFPLSSDAEFAIGSLSDGGDDNVFWGGVALTVSF
jgi:hypothetical protein